jgi:hypothetical protein
MTRCLRIRSCLLMGCVAVGLGLLLALPMRLSANADGGCAETYTVRRGDTLRRIAQEMGISYDALVAANLGRITNPDWLYVGEVLCLPPAPSDCQQPTTAAAAQPAAVSSKVVLEADYRFSPSDDEDKLALPRNGELGKRSTLLLRACNPVTVFTETREITQALASGRSPVLVGMRNRNAQGRSDMDYTLVGIGMGEILSRLAISGTLPITPSSGPDQSGSLTSFLAQPGLDEAGLSFILEAEDGVRMPFYVTALDVVLDYQRFKQFYLDRRSGDAEALVRADDIGFVLYPADEGRYHLMLRLSPDGYGPPGWTTKQRCEAWRNRRGGWFSFFRSFYRCSRR